MRTFNLSCVAAAALVLAPPVLAEESASSPHHFSANVGLYSQYVFRGLTQTNEDPALQGGLDYSHDSGFYAGTWLSNMSWFSDLNPGNSVSLEWDGYLGFKKSWAGGITTDIGYLRYEYPGSYPALAPGVLKPNTDEVYLGLGWKWVSLKYSYSVNDLFGVPNSDGSYYLDLTVTIPIVNTLSLSVHAGKQGFEGTGNDALFGYEDYRGTVSYGFGQAWTVSGTYTQSTAKEAGYTVLGENLGDDQILVAISRVF